MFAIDDMFDTEEDFEPEEMYFPPRRYSRNMASTRGAHSPEELAEAAKVSYSGQCYDEFRRSAVLVELGIKLPEESPDKHSTDKELRILSKFYYRMENVLPVTETGKAVLVHWELPAGCEFNAIDMWIPKGWIRKQEGTTYWVSIAKFKGSLSDIAHKVY